MNKNIVSIFLLIPFLVVLIYIFLGSYISNQLTTLFEQKDQNKATNTAALDLNVIQPQSNLTILSDTIQTDDNKALGYTGQNKLALDSLGNIYFAYRHKVEGKYEIFLAKLSKDHKLIFNKAITEIGSTQRVPSITIDNQNTIHIVWYGLSTAEETDKLGRQIKYSQSKDQGETWSTPINIGPVAGYKNEDYWQEHPQISSYNKNLYIVWEGKDADNTSQQIKFISSINNGTTWSNWKNISVTPKTTQSRPSIVIDANGKLHLFYYSNADTSNPQIRYSTSNNNGQTWTTPIIMSNNINSDARHVTAAYLKDKIIAVWREGPSDRDKGPTQIYYSILTTQQNTWTKPQVVSGSKSFQYFPSITTNGSSAAISWMESKTHADFPNEDPTPGNIYLSFIDLNKQAIATPIFVDNNGAYPHLTLDVENNIFYLIYEKNIDPSTIILKSGTLN